MVKAPCYKCPDRTAECHAHCNKWSEYETARDAEYARRKKEGERSRMLSEIEWQRTLRINGGRRKRNG